MASPNTQSSENSNQGNEAENLDASLSKRAQFLVNFCPQQNWALPDSMIYRLTMNPSNPKGYQKLMQSCKHFFVKNPILINENLSVCLLGDNGIVMYFEEKDAVQLNNISSKFWITEAVYFRSDENSNSDLVSSVIPKIYQVDAIKISLFNQNILYQNFKILSSKVEMLLFYKVTVKDENGIIVGPEILVEALPKLKVFSLSSNTSVPALSFTITSKSFNELLKIPHFLTLESCSFIYILQDFDIETFYTYMKKNKRTKFFLYFDDSISEVCKNRIEEIIDEILATTNHDYKIPFISFADADREKSKKLENLYKN